MPDGVNDDPGRWHFSSGASHETLTDDPQRAGSTTVLDAHLLFHAEFKRAGDDLRLVGSRRSKVRKSSENPAPGVGTNLQTTDSLRGIGSVKVPSIARFFIDVPSARVP
jgi:hypothetical protein